MERIAVFCGSRVGRRPIYSQAARSLGELLAQQGIELVYGGGSIGLMGILADATLAAGGRVIGVIPGALAQKEVMHEGLNDLRIVRTMHERKAMMAQLADAFIALPGGFGTMDELFEILTWAQLGEHAKPIGLLDVDSFFDPLLALARHMVDEGFLKSSNLNLILEEQSPAALLERLVTYRAEPKVPIIDSRSL